MATWSYELVCVAKMLSPVSAAPAISSGLLKITAWRHVGDTVVLASWIVVRGSRRPGPSPFASLVVRICSARRILSLHMGSMSCVVLVLGGGSVGNFDVKNILDFPNLLDSHT